MKGKVVGIRTDEGVSFHAPNPGLQDFDTLCAIDSDDPDIGHLGMFEAPKGQKITCQQCWDIWHGVSSLKIKESDFQL